MGMNIALFTAAAGGAALIVALAAQDRGGWTSEVRRALWRWLSIATATAPSSAAELLAAPAALKQLDANGDGLLTGGGCRPSFPGRRGREGFGRGEGGERSGAGGLA